MINKSIADNEYKANMIKKIAFLFPGQGTQRIGMTQDICGAFPCAAEAYKQADEVLGRPISDVVFYGEQQQLDLTHNTQPALLVAEIAVLRVLEEAGIVPVYAAGFSLGEWTALVAAKVIPFTEALQLIQLRADVMQQAVPNGEGGMAVVIGKDAAFVESLCKRTGEYIIPSNYNCSGQITVAGTSKGISTLLCIAEKEGIMAQKLSVSIPSHCALMQPAAERLAKALIDVDFEHPKYPIVMNTTGAIETDRIRIKENIIAQLTQPVQFEQSLHCMMKSGVDTFVEIGPGRTLSGFVKRVAKQREESPTILRTDDLQALQTTLMALDKDRIE